MHEEDLDKTIEEPVRRSWFGRRRARRAVPTSFQIRRIDTTELRTLAARATLASRRLHTMRTRPDPLETQRHCAEFDQASLAPLASTLGEQASSSESVGPVANEPTPRPSVFGRMMLGVVLLAAGATLGTLVAKFALPHHDAIGSKIAMEAHDSETGRQAVHVSSAAATQPPAVRPSEAAHAAMAEPVEPEKDAHHAEKHSSRSHHRHSHSSDSSGAKSHEHASYHKHDKEPVERAVHAESSSGGADKSHRAESQSHRGSSARAARKPATATKSSGGDEGYGDDDAIHRSAEDAHAQASGALESAL